VTAEGQEAKQLQDLTVSLDESYNNKAGKDSSVRRKSITNSAYQRRRLSAESVKQSDDLRCNEPFPEGEQQQIADAECFFVDDVPVRVDISDNDTPYGLMEGKISEEKSKGGTTNIVNMNSAFVERQSTEERKWKSSQKWEMIHIVVYRWKTERNVTYNRQSKSSSWQSPDLT